MPDVSWGGCDVRERRHPDPPNAPSVPDPP
ncbi:protein of unknown function [Blastococcus saxobsidens DD2]|uniref:Uncharacterized protein n=1 Tax=Blastococcus saxobsidens (strain DD2) TaxID=1146883 RepID=H6RJG1_BLASD|nr:protein of unknown function [Blastococcus saxobsidens DD2]